MNWIFLIATYGIMILVILWLKRLACPRHYIVYIITVTWWDLGSKHITIITPDENMIDDYWDSFGDDGEMYDINAYREDGELKVAVYRLVNKNGKGIWTQNDMVQVPESETFFTVRERVA